MPKSMRPPLSQSSVHILRGVDRVALRHEGDAGAAAGACWSPPPGTRRWRSRPACRRPAARESALLDRDIEGLLVEQDDMLRHRDRVEAHARARPKSRIICGVAFGDINVEKTPIFMLALLAMVNLLAGLWSDGVAHVSKTTSARLSPAACRVPHFALSRPLISGVRTIVVVPGPLPTFLRNPACHRPPSSDAGAPPGNGVGGRCAQRRASVVIGDRQLARPGRRAVDG